MGYEQVGRDIYNEIRSSDETPNMITRQEFQEITRKYAGESENIRRITQIGLQAFRDAVSLSSEQIQYIQQTIGARSDGVFGPNTFNKYLFFLQDQGRILSLNQILERNRGTPERPMRIERREDERLRNSILSYPIQNRTHARQLQQFLRERGHYNMSIDGIFGRGSKRALQEYLRDEGHYSGAIDGVIGRQSLQALRDLLAGVRPRPMTDRDIQRSDTVLQESESFRGIERLPGRFRVIFYEMYQKLRPNEQQEVLSQRKPFTLVDARSKQLLFVDGNRMMSMNVILGENGTTSGGYVQGDRRTPIERIHRFNRVVFSENKGGRSLLRSGQPYYPDLMPADNGTWRNLYFDTSIQGYRGEKLVNGTWRRNRQVTVTGFSIQSDLAMQYGGRYFHGVGPGRRGTWGCVGIRYQDIPKGRAMARSFAAKGGFGYVSRA